MDIKFSVRGQLLDRIDSDVVVADSKRYVIAHFSFSEDWENTIKTVTFKNQDIAMSVVLDNTDTCEVPWETLFAGILTVSVFGVLEDKVITTKVCSVKVLNSGYLGGETPREPSLDIYQQIVSRLNDIELGGVSEELVREVVEKYLGEHGTISEDDIIRVIKEYVNLHKDELRGERGPQGEQGLQGLPGEKGDKGSDGANGKDGVDGKNGADGKDGRTPIKGTDYFTEADKQELVQSVLNSLVNGEEVAY